MDGEKCVGKGKLVDRDKGVFVVVSLIGDGSESVGVRLSCEIEV